MEDEGLTFGRFDMYFVYGFLFHIQLPAPVHLFLRERDEESFRKTWGVGNLRGESGVYPTLISVPEERAELRDIKKDNVDGPHRAVWLGVNCESVARETEEKEGEEKRTALSTSRRLKCLRQLR